MNIIHIIIGWLVLMLGYLLWMKFREDLRTGKKLHEFGDFNFLVRSLLVLFICWLGFSIVHPEPRFSSDREQAEYGEETLQPWLSAQALLREAKAHPDSLDLHFRLFEAHFTQENSNINPPSEIQFNREGVEIFNFYTSLSEKTEDAKLSDIGYLFLANWYVNRTGFDAENASFCLRQVKNTDMKYANFIAGRVALHEAGAFAAEPYFLTEIANKGYRQGAWAELSWIYEAGNRGADLRKLVYAEESRSSVPDHLRYKVYFIDGKIFSYYGLRFGNMFSTLPLWGILGGLIILFTWLFFLRRLSFLSPVKWQHFALAIGIGALLAMSSWMLYEFYHHVLGFRTNGEIRNDFLYCFLGIGFIEELVKLIPFLIILHFTRIIKKPVDYILIASASGLGFAFFENLLYISQYGLDVIHTRALTASVSHMASSAIIAYGFVLVKFRYPGKPWIIPLFFLAAAFAHGFYDFWLLNEKVRSLSILTLFFYLSEILVYVSFLNNALNQSAKDAKNPKDVHLNTSRLASFIAGALILVFVIEYVGTSLVYGTTIGNKTLTSALFSGGYLVFFLSVRLSNIDIVPGQWARIEFFTGLFPTDLLSGTRKQKRQSVAGQTIILRSTRVDGLLYRHFPLAGVIRRELTIRGEGDWFELRPDLPFEVAGMDCSTLYFHITNSGEELGKGFDVNVGVFAKIPDPVNPAKSKLKFLDWAWANSLTNQ